MKSRFDISNEKHFDDYLKARSSCYLVEQAGNDFYCDCYKGMKARYCKHSVGLMYKTELLEVSSEVRSKPLGQKRKRGRPKKLPACLTKSPQPQIPNSTYHSPQLHLSHKQQEDLQKAIQLFPSSEIRKDQGNWRNFLIFLLLSKNPELKKLRLLTTILRNELRGLQKEKIIKFKCSISKVVIILCFYYF